MDVENWENVRVKYELVWIYVYNIHTQSITIIYKYMYIYIYIYTHTCIYILYMYIYNIYNWYMYIHICLYHTQKYSTLYYHILQIPWNPWLGTTCVPQAAVVLGSEPVGPMRRCAAAAGIWYVYEYTWQVWKCTRIYIICSNHIYIYIYMLNVYTCIRVMWRDATWRDVMWCDVM